MAQPDTRVETAQPPKRFVGWPRGRRDELVDAMALGDLAIPRLYDAYIANDLDDVRARLRDIDLSPLVDEWLHSVATALAPETTERYMLYVRSLIPADAPFPRSQLTAASIQQWISSRPVAPSTQRKHRACLSSFCQYLVVQTGVLTHNPVRDTIAPSPGDAGIGTLRWPKSSR